MRDVYKDWTHQPVTHKIRPNFEANFALAYMKSMQGKTIEAGDHFGSHAGNGAMVQKAEGVFTNLATTEPADTEIMNKLMTANVVLIADS